MTVTIDLPSKVFDDGLVNFVELLGQGNEADSVILDFSGVEFWIPGAVVGLITKARAWRDAGKEVHARNFGPSRCPASKYLQRMDFFRHCGIHIKEDFNRHGARNRFVALTPIAYGASRSVTQLANDIAGVFFPDEDTEEAWESGEVGAYGYVEFAISELGNNVLQHSKASGYLMAQYYPNGDTVRIGIADFGIGIRRSFQENSAPFAAADDIQAVQLALQPRVSSKEHLELRPGTAVNRGMGLTFLRELSLAAKGNFLVLSGNGYYSLTKEGTLAARAGFQGTFCALSVRRAEAESYSRLLMEAKQRFGLLSEPATYPGLFS